MILLIKTRFDRLALPLGLVGIAAAALYNWHLWQRDKAYLAGRAKPDSLPPLEEWPDLPKVSILVAAWNEAGNIERHIRSFLALRYPNKELLICAGGEDGTFDLASSHQDSSIQVLKQRKGDGKQKSLARSFPLSTGSIIFLTDADCNLDDQCFENTIEPLVSGREQAATGRFSPLAVQRENSFVQQQWYVDTYWRERSPDYIEGLIGRNAAVNRDVLEGIGGFAAGVKTGTDYYLARQLTGNGTRIRYVHESSIETEFQTSAAKYLRQQSRWLRNIILHGSSFAAWQQVKGAVLQCTTGFVFLVWPAAVIIFGWTAPALWLILFSHGSLSRMRRIRYGELVLDQRHRPKTYIHAPLYFLLDQVMLANSLLEWLIPGLRWRW
jgi:cellulose synthase/poly-beta-1,6-N-acetylglucosamine synthase-like glycosyltransferase